MPKLKSSLSSKIHAWIRSHNHGTEILVSNGKLITCLLCRKDFICTKKNHVDSHCLSSKSLLVIYAPPSSIFETKARVVYTYVIFPSGVHKSEVQKAKLSRLKQSTIPTTQHKADSSSTFNHDLCEAFLAANIPLFKVNHPVLKMFLETYTPHRVPDESTLRKNYVPVLCNETIEEIRTKVRDSFVYIIVDETTDTRGSYVVHLLLGILRADQAGDPYLIASKEIENANGATNMYVCEQQPRSILSRSVFLRQNFAIYI